MASYNYLPPGPTGPPGPPGPSPPSQGPPPPAPYISYNNSNGQYRGRQSGGRARGNFHQGSVGRGESHPQFSPVSQSYPPVTGPYPATHGNYAQPGWHTEQTHHGRAPNANPLPPQNYHPNYAPQIYQQPQYPSTGSQPPYSPSQPTPPPPAQPYNQSYPPNQSGNSSQHEWSTHRGGHSTHAQQNYSGGRGRGGDRGGRNALVMGPPIRMGFSESRAHDHAQASTQGYHPFPDPQQPPYPPFGGYPSTPVPPAQPHGPPASSYDFYAGSSASGGGTSVGSGGSHRGHGGYHHAGGGRGHHSHNHGHGHNYNHNRSHRSGHGNDKFHHPHKSINPTTNQQHQKPDDSSVGKKKKRKTNINDRDIGLIPSEAEVKEEGVDEEEALKEMIGNALLEPSDVVAYLAARKLSYPTKLRIELKRSELAKLQAVESQKRSTTQSSKLAQKELEAAKLRKRLEKLDSQIKRKREQHDEGDDMRDVDESSSSSSEDEKPEISSATKPASLPPAPSKADPTKHCKYYSTGGTCGKKGKCRFVHDPTVREAAIKQREANGGKLTLEQRLLLNDKEQEDLTVLKAIQHLKFVGKLHGPGFGHSVSVSTPVANTSLPSSTSSVIQSTLAFPSSLPPHPPPQIDKCKQKVRREPESGGNTADGVHENVAQVWSLHGYENEPESCGNTQE